MICSTHARKKKFYFRYERKRKKKEKMTYIIERTTGRKKTVLRVVVVMFVSVDTAYSDCEVKTCKKLLTVDVNITYSFFSPQFYDRRSRAFLPLVFFLMVLTAVLSLVLGMSDTPWKTCGSLPAAYNRTACPTDAGTCCRQKWMPR